ncbi:MAG: hypothetical protein ACKOOC_09785, partial [Cyanobium sp.]
MATLPFSAPATALVTSALGAMVALGALCCGGAWSQQSAPLTPSAPAAPSALPRSQRLSGPGPL